MPTEHRYTIIDNETGRRMALSTDELQVLYWLAENESARLNRIQEVTNQILENKNHGPIRI